MHKSGEVNMKVSRRFVIYFAMVSLWLVFSLDVGVVRADNAQDRTVLLRLLSGYEYMPTREALDKQFGERAAAVLIEVLNNKVDSDIRAAHRRRALKLLGLYDCQQFPEVMSFLLNYIGSPSNSEQSRHAAMTSLGQACKEEAIPQLSQHLSSDNAWLREGAIKGLEATGSPSALSKLEGALTQEHEPKFQERINQAIDRLKENPRPTPEP